MHPHDFIIRAGKRIARVLGLPEPGPVGIGGHANPPGEPFPGPHSTGRMATLLRTHEGPEVHKWEHYLPIYDRYLSPYLAGFPLAEGGFRPLRLLEIGVSQGGSLALWRRYFGPEAVIFGIDIEPRCATFDGRDGQVRIGSQADPAFLRKVVDEMGGVDIVIDDGSHVASHQRASISTLFPLLSDEGLYICEDVHTAYWPGWLEGGYGRRGSFIGLTRGLIDDLHSAWHGRALTAPWAAGKFDAVHIHDSVVVIEKRQKARLLHGKVGVQAW